MYGLAKWLFQRLKFLTADSETTVRSPTQFLEKLKRDLAVEAAKLLLRSRYDETETRLGYARILQLLKFCLKIQKVWARYVDDASIVIERDQVLTFKEHLNSIFPDIQFTMEEEKNNQLAFLDVLVYRRDCGGLKTTTTTQSNTNAIA
ncbi:unnamed protein product [Dibothriocephalus latus]|uniref:Reverse transcriptase domain-containing protein n=1 Tax=Dibothriocephalus latus TaxID=60516 RepID=A0A3P7LGV6_DIBLA|nr:unnamed protein product [Dibothriocephalus latus]